MDLNWNLKLVPKTRHLNYQKNTVIRKEWSSLAPKPEWCMARPKLPELGPRKQRPPRLSVQIKRGVRAPGIIHLPYNSHSLILPSKTSDEKKNEKFIYMNPLSIVNELRRKPNWDEKPTNKMAGWVSYGGDACF